ncbi:Ribonuclease P protein subunit p40 [Operophtera brumata]|uniref:Ribonuclease P protein subunit p40 n=1 Tax=Operophtera brumata TaxID=104452 RepID=A0A0L7KZR5_OPEBR|nr:Ribonuclease P protein subunit p40 [Operophtera brumata]
MICPEISNFPPPKTMGTSKQNVSLEYVTKTINLNSFYTSLVITCPDEIQTPGAIEDIVTEDSDYYKITGCSLTELVEPMFIENFVKKGSIYCLSANRSCMVQNCVAITPDGYLTVHVLEFIYQTLGLQGTKRPHNYYEVKIDLKTLKQHSKVKQSLSKLELFDLYITWEPHEETVCPSSIAKYFCDRNINVSVQTLEFKEITPDISEIPSIKDVDAEEMVEWIGMLAHGADLAEPETYISTYYEPESESSLKSTRISLLIVKGFIPSPLHSESGQLVAVELVQSEDVSSP